LKIFLECTGTISPSRENEGQLGYFVIIPFFVVSVCTLTSYYHSENITLAERTGAVKAGIESPPMSGEHDNGRKAKQN
jgi:hypothetical protein